jgi:predicted RNase H-related nuclease YkuK (DUF458 family)
MKREIDIQEVKAFLEDCGPDTKVYIGCDSERYKVGNQWFADYILAVVVHINGKNGCKIFGAIQKEMDYDKKFNRPRMRLMTEVYKISDLYLQLAQEIPNEIEVHLDINPSEMHGSSCVVNEAIGYVRGMCNVIPLVKPRAFAASYAADRMKDVMGMQKAA